MKTIKINLKELLEIASLTKGTEFENKIYLVGGAVRDLLLGHPVKDIDLVIELPNGGVRFSEWMTSTYPDKCRHHVIYETYGTAKFSLTIDSESFEIECVAPRCEEYERTSRNPVCREADLMMDCMRRDLTINSLYLNIHTNEVIDLSELGLEDLNNHILRTPCDPEITFSDDPLRMLRVIRFASRYGWEIESKTWSGIISNCSRLDIISKERIADELSKILLTDKPSIGLNRIMSSGLMDYIIPELVNTLGMSQNKYHDCDVWEHTMRVLDKVPAKLELRLAALLHDIGKINTKTVENGEVHFYKHELEGVPLVEMALKSLKFSNKIIDKVKILVGEHMRTKMYGPNAEVSTKALRKLKYDLGENLNDLLELIHADNCSHAPNSKMPNQVPMILKKLNELKDEPPKIKLPINGNDLIETFGIKPGPIIKELLDVVKESVLTSPDISKQDALGIVGEYFRIHHAKLC